jgi:recombination protein RecT
MKMSAIEKSYTDNLGEFLRANKTKIVSALNDSIQFERFAAVAMNTLRRTPALAQCSPASVIDAVNRCAELGLEPGSPLGHAYLVPFKQECQLIIGYRGYLHLMFRSGGLKDAQAHVVYENDKFVGRLGTDPMIEHTIGFGKRGRVIGAYCVLRFVNGGLHVESMNMDELTAVQSVSRAKSGPWLDWPDEMRRKTVLKRAAKWGPTGDNLELISKAQEYDDDTIDSTATRSTPTQTTHSLVSDNGVAAALDATDRVKAAIPAEPGAEG